MKNLDGFTKTIICITVSTLPIAVIGKVAYNFYALHLVSKRKITTMEAKEMKGV